MKIKFALFLSAFFFLQTSAPLAVPVAFAADEKPAQKKELTPEEMQAKKKKMKKLEKNLKTLGKAQKAQKAQNAQDATASVGQVQSAQRASRVPSARY